MPLPIMKIIYILITILLCSSVSAQHVDTTLDITAKWKKGEKKELVITRKKEKIENDKYDPSFNLTYLAHISILDSTSEVYTIQWTLDLPKELKESNPGIEKSMPIYNGFKIIFTTDKKGSFKNLTNWEEVRDVYMNMSSASIQGEDSIGKATFDKVKAMFNSQQMVEAAFIKDVQLYYAPYGGQFTTQGVSSSTLLPNPFGGESMPAVTLQKIEKINPEINSFTAIFTQKLDSTGTRILMSSMYKALDLPADKIDSVNKYTNDMLSKFRIEDNSEYQVVSSTGWIISLKYERIGFIDKMKQTETFLIRMK